MTSLGMLIKHYRKINDLTMDDFSDLSGVSKGYIGILESEINPNNNKVITPSLKIIKKVAGAMNLSVDAVLELMK